MSDEKVIPILSVKSAPAALRPYHFDEDGGLKPGSASKKKQKPYVRFELSELQGVPVAAGIVWILLLRQWHVTKQPWAAIPKRVWQTAGLSRWHLYRGLNLLESAGLVALMKESGKSTQIRRL